MLKIFCKKEEDETFGSISSAERVEIIFLTLSLTCIDRI